LRNPLVTTGGVPAPQRTIATAQMHTYHCARAVYIGERRVVRRDVILQRLIRLDPERPPLLPSVLGDVIRVVRIIQLQIDDALVDERAKLRVDDRRGVREQRLPTAIDRVGY